MSSVQIRDVRKSFGRFDVPDGTAIPIEDGGFVVPVGSAAGILTLSQLQNLDGVSGRR